MTFPDPFQSLMNLGLFRSVEIISSFAPRPTTRNIITRAKALFELRKYADVLRALDLIDKTQRTEEEMNEILELRFSCCLANHNTAASMCSGLLPLLANRILTPKLHLLAAEAYILQDATHSPNHPAIPHLLEVLRLFPHAVELAEKLLMVGASIDSIDSIVSRMPTGAAKQFLQALQFSSRCDFERANSILGGLVHSVAPMPACVLNQICLNAFQANQMELFDSNAALIRYDDLEIIDLRAKRLKILKKQEKLSQLVLYGLNADEDNANAWLAFSHLLELNSDGQRALQATRKALLLDRNSRRGYMRHGELRMQRKDYRKASTAFVKAHQLSEGFDSYKAIVTCWSLLEDWPAAESYAARAAITYPPDGEHGANTLTVMGLAYRGRDPARAVRLLRKALDKGQKQREALEALVDLRLKANDMEGAQALLNEYREEGGDFYYFLKMGEIAGRNREFEKALEYATNANRLEPDDDTARELLNQLESMMRDNDSENEAEEETVSF
jgi:tetratricopeptide (TPR) repeat protein